MRVDFFITVLGAVAVTVFTCSQMLHSSQRRFALTSARFESLGEDADWNVQGWDKKHMSAVSADVVDKPTVKNIWHSRSQAWSGIDRIFPTDGGYSYQINHVINGK